MGRLNDSFNTLSAVCIIDLLRVWDKKKKPFKILYEIELYGLFSVLGNFK